MLNEVNILESPNEYSVSDQGWSEGGGPRNMKYKGPLVVAIFFMTSFNRDRGGHGPPGPPGSAAEYYQKQV